jgi:DNA polymerase elongation subunit (family B)
VTGINRIVCDIETYALPDAAEFIDEPTAPSNWKDPDKIAEYVREATAKAISRCALDIDLCQIVAVGIYDPEADQPITLHLASNGVEEGAALEAFWEAARHRSIVGFNILNFDLPVLIRRSQYLNVDYPHTISVDRYRSTHVDLAELLSFNRKISPWRSLDFYCRRFGIDVPDLVKGKDIDALVKAEDWAGVARHCRSDILKTKLLAERLGVLPTIGTPTLLDSEVVL